VHQFPDEFFFINTGMQKTNEREVDDMMKSHQRRIREERDELGSDCDLFGDWYSSLDKKLVNTEIKRIDYNTARKMIEAYEWIGTMPLPKSCRYIFGIYFEGCLGGVEVFVEPSTRQFNEQYPRKVVQLNRGACAYWTPKNTASYFISRCLKLLKDEGVIAVIAYCTVEAGEFGTIYQSLGFDYVGDTAPSKTYFLDGHWIAERTLADKKKWAKGKGDIWVDIFNRLPSRGIQPKFRYLKLIGTHKQNKEFLQTYHYVKKSYPKRNTKRGYHGSNREGVGSTLISLQDL
tara:strand:+ start:21 stop:887 length:867 start_codon:yes stop_codon:yes gene_type:complete